MIQKLLQGTLCSILLTTSTISAGNEGFSEAKITNEEEYVHCAVSDKWNNNAIYVNTTYRHNPNETNTSRSSSDLIPFIRLYLDGTVEIVEKGVLFVTHQEILNVMPLGFKISNGKSTLLIVPEADYASIIGRMHSAIFECVIASIKASYK